MQWRAVDLPTRRPDYPWGRARHVPCYPINRPYPNKNALLKKKVLGKKKFEAIEDYVFVARGYEE